MFTVDQKSNRITAVNSKSFTELKLSERNHLQEWLAHTPSCLGEDLLVIQKEFDGFDDTRERLDLLALDKDGNLVIIENKLDDSGRDVVWQALKYASYCASLSKMQVVEIYQQYLVRYGLVVDVETDGEKRSLDAAEQLCEFLEVPELDEVKVNLGNSQRIMLVAANFRKEVTSTALWLLGQGISVQCFKITPYSLDEQLLINIDQIIPTPEAGELMIGIKAKEAQEKSTEVVLKKRYVARRAYWEQLLEVFQGSSCSLYNNISARKDHWLPASCGLSGCHYSLIFAQKELRVELTLGRSSSADNDFLFDFLHERKQDIEASFGASLNWLRLEKRKSARLQFGRPADSSDKDSWPEWIAWHLEYMTKLEQALKAPMQQAADALKQQNS